MGFPSKLKDMNFFGDGTTFRGVISEVTLPKLTMKLEDWRSGGMAGPVQIDMGLEKLELEFKAGGLLREAFSQFGATSHSAQLNRFAGAYQDDDSGAVTAVEVVTRGRPAEIDMGGAKPGDDTEHTFKIAASYYKLTVDGEDWIEVDMVAGTFIVFGQDRRAEIRAAIGT